VLKIKTCSSKLLGKDQAHLCLFPSLLSSLFSSQSILKETFLWNISQLLLLQNAKAKMPGIMMNSLKRRSLQGQSSKLSSFASSSSRGRFASGCLRRDSLTTGTTATSTNTNSHCSSPRLQSRRTSMSSVVSDVSLPGHQEAADNWGHFVDIEWSS